MAWIDEITLTGPKDIYEKVALSLDVPDALEFLVSECQTKDRLITIMAKILKNEAGEDWWSIYVDQKCQNIDTIPLSLPPLSPSETKQANYINKLAGSDIPF
jgi:hypothetical protein